MRKLTEGKRQIVEAKQDSIRFDNHPKDTDYSDDRDDDSSRYYEISKMNDHKNQLWKKRKKIMTKIVKKDSVDDQVEIRNLYRQVNLIDDQIKTLESLLMKRK